MSPQPVRIIGDFDDPLQVETEDGRQLLLHGLTLVGVDMEESDGRGQCTQLSVTVQFNKTFDLVVNPKSSCDLDHGNLECSLEKDHEGKCHLRTGEKNSG